jgi:5'-3' exonuclease
MKLLKQPNNEKELEEFIKQQKQIKINFLRKGFKFDKVALIDADYIPYKIAYVTDDIFTSYQIMYNMIEQILKNTRCSHYIMFHTTKCNFRNKVTNDYKANRKDFEKTQHYYRVRKMMYDIFHTCSYKCYEADDLVTMVHRKLGTYKSVIVSPDKDLLQVTPGYIYNPNKQIITVVKPNSIGVLKLVVKTKINNKGKSVKNSKVTGKGYKFLFWQSLVGDSSDNIKGVKGIGPVKAYNLLYSCKTMKEMYDVVLKEYTKTYKTPKKELSQQLKLLRMVHSDSTFVIPEPQLLN